MPYIVSNSDGSQTVTVSDSVVDTSSYSLALIGRNVSNYGQYFAQNTIRHLENFASTTAPSPGVKLIGQLWYDKSEDVMRVWDGSVWKRSTNIVIGNETNRPTQALAGGGTSFFNTETNKLEIHNGSSWKFAGYAGEVTNRYSSDSRVNNPDFYGTRIRNIFLKDSNDISYPVLAISYVKTTSTLGAGANAGTTSIDGQNETVMAIFSDYEFTIDPSKSAEVDGLSVSDLPAELIDVGGIAYARDGRLTGQILKGLNQRAEFETSGITRVSSLFADFLGSASDSIGQAWIDDLTVRQSLTVDAGVAVDIQGDLNVDDDVTIDGDLTATTGSVNFRSMTVSNDATFNGTTTLNDNTIINGVLTVNGVNTQNIGTDSEKIENLYGDQIDTQNLTVDVTATIAQLNATNSTISQDLTVQNNLTVNNATQLDGALTVDGITTLNQSLSALNSANFALGLTVSPNQDIVLNSGDILGVADISASTFTGGSFSGTTMSATGGFTGDLTGDVTGDLTGNTNGTHTGPVVGNVTGNVNGNVTGDVTGDITGDVTGNADSASAVNVTINNDNLSYFPLFAGASGNQTPKTDSNFTYNPSTGILDATRFAGVASTAEYADLAEIYASDEKYEPGTVVKLGGSAEITQTTSHNDTEVFGVISTDPAYLMNKSAEGLPVAMTGRVPVKVIGKVKKGERLISSDVPGVAWALADEAYDPRAVIGRSLQNKEDGDAGIVEAVIGVK